jgi:hypothetical protein
MGPRQCAGREFSLRKPPHRLGKAVVLFVQIEIHAVSLWSSAGF